MDPHNHNQHSSMEELRDGSYPSPTLRPVALERRRAPGPSAMDESLDGSRPALTPPVAVLSSIPARGAPVDASSGGDTSLNVVPGTYPALTNTTQFSWANNPVGVRNPYTAVYPTNNSTAGGPNITPTAVAVSAVAQVRPSESPATFSTPRPTARGARLTQDYHCRVGC